MTAYYNEFDPYAAQWLRNLISAGHIAPGVVDQRSITEVTPDDLKGFKQVHFFAGVGVWSYALRRAGWPDDRPVWTGSCPCQPFSAAGRRKGKADDRHLWPVFYRLVKECRPVAVFGEQVASNDGLDWLDNVLFDLESADYAAAAVDLCAAGVGAPHIRQRLFWVADAIGNGSQRGLPGGQDAQREAVDRSARRSGADHRLADADRERCEVERVQHLARKEGDQAAGSCADHRLAHAHGDECLQSLPGGRGEESRKAPSEWAEFLRAGVSGRAGNALRVPGTAPTIGAWGAVEWLLCKDNKYRPVKPGLIPLVDGAPGRMGRLRAYGNALAAPVAETFIRAYLEAANDEYY
ncbi:TPA: DNA cytosine methyltransferase [Klebsiella aerogenes]|nr:DNA cytosine methyltransferase [Klebsiella aerogenes]